MPPAGADGKSDHQGRHTMHQGFSPGFGQLSAGASRPGQ
jgi:hypothetical protein